MLKKSLFVPLLLVFSIFGCKKEPPQSTYVGRPRPEPVEQAKPTLPPTDQLGAKTTFELSYHGITGKEDDIQANGGWGFGSTEDVNPFIQEVQNKARHDLFISRNSFLYDRPLTGVEYKGKEVLHAYFDINGDGKLSDDERLDPAADIAERNRRGDETTVFITPDFTLTNAMGDKMPFRVLMWVNFYGNSTPNVTWSPMSVYQGTAEFNGQEMQLYLFPDFDSKSYTHYGRSRYGMIPVSTEKPDWIPQSTFSSLVVHDENFYRVTVDEVSPENQTIKITFIEDKTPRGSIAMNVKGKEDFKNKLSHSNLHGDSDNTIHFNIQEGMNELPEGDYNISYGSFRYGKDDIDEYSTSFRTIPAFAVKAGETTTVELGKPEVKVQAVEENKRYHNNKTYKTEFSKDTKIYIDASFVGMAGEIYRNFQQRVKKNNHYRHEDFKARILITDSKGKEVINKELEYG